MSYLSVEQKKQKVSEIKAGIDEAESLVPTLLFLPRVIFNVLYLQ